MPQFRAARANLCELTRRLKNDSLPPMKGEVTPEELQALRGKRVEVIAFGISYVGCLEKIDLKMGTIKIVDKDDFVVLEIERIEGFRHV